MNRVAVIGITGTSVFLGVGRFHTGGETVHADDIHIEYGGKGFNQAVAAARAGAEVSFLSALGHKDIAPVRDLLAQEKIDFVPAGKDSESAYAVIMTNRTGETRVTVHRGAELMTADVEAFADRIARADILLLTNEVPEDVNIRAAEIAAQHGVKVILNPAPARPLPDALRRLVSLYTPNEFETAGLENTTGVIVTLGADGCLLRDSNTHIPAVDCGKAVDTTGAGDTFNGVLAARLSQGLSLEEAARTGNRAAAQSVTARYVLPSIPHLQAFPSN